MPAGATTVRERPSADTVAGSMVVAPQSTEVVAVNGACPNVAPPKIATIVPPDAGPWLGAIGVHAGIYDGDQPNDHGIPTAPFALIESESDLVALLANDSPLAPRPTTDAPIFLKPVQEGSSKGITERNLARSRAELEATARFLLSTYRQSVIAEGFLPGAEFTCGVLGNGRSARVLPLVGMNFASLPPGALPIYGYEAKWVWDTPDRPLDIFECPAPVDLRLQHAIEDVVLRAYRLLGCRDWSRIDVRLDEQGVPNIVEVNPLPGILPNPADNSCLPKAARAAGMSYDALIQSALVAAAGRTGVHLDAPVPVRTPVRTATLVA